jgi:ABC-type sugar transport system ATPase subunit
MSGPGNAVEAPHPVIEVRAVTKRYGALTALHGVDLALDSGEVVGLVGDNGAGKSTLVKVVSGATAPTSGEVYVDGRRVTFRSPVDARRHGIETVYQDLALTPDLTVSENLFLGRELRRRGPLWPTRMLDRGRMNREARAQLQRLGIRIDAVNVLATSLSGGQRQAIAVARAVAWGRRVILMDEPTAALGVEEQQKVAELIGEVRRGGMPILLVSHNIPQVHSICDRVVVLYHGRAVANLRTDAADVDEIIRWITGAALAYEGRFGGDGSAERN